MEYYINKVLKEKSFDQAIEAVTSALKDDGFGILTEIDVKDTLKKKLDVDFRKYKILGACNPQFAYQAFQAEDKIGVLLPCNVIVQEHENGSVEVAAMNPLGAMSVVQNEKLETLAGEVEKIMIKVIGKLE